MEAQTIDIRVDADRMRATLKVRDILALQGGDMQTMVNILSMFVWNGDGYAPEDEAREQVLEMTLDELQATAQAVTNAMQGAAVPKASAQE
jgi:hypothetical protein